MNAGWFGVLAAGLGALAAGLPQAATAWIQRGTAKAQREHERAENEARRRHEDAERERERRAAVRARHVDQIREWRDGLAASHREYDEWEAQRKITGRVVMPNIVSAAWFQSLRPYLSSDADRSIYLQGDEIQCHSSAAGVLGLEIARIEQEWLDEDKG